MCSGVLNTLRRSWHQPYRHREAVAIMVEEVDVSVGHVILYAESELLPLLEETYNDVMAESQLHALPRTQRQRGLVELQARRLQVVLRRGSCGAGSRRQSCRRWRGSGCSASGSLRAALQKCRLHLLLRLLLHHQLLELLGLVLGVVEPEIALADHAPAAPAAAPTSSLPEAPAGAAP